MTDRKQVTETTSILSGKYDSKNIEDLIHELKHLRSQGYSKVELNEQYYPYDRHGTIVLTAIKYRKETDAEYQKRIKEEEHQKELRRLEYERLRKEFDHAQH